jgi:hypothetical protein
VPLASVRTTALAWLSVMLFASLPAMAQQSVRIDWTTKNPTSPPITVDKSVAVTVVVENVNDMLYGYRERIVAHPRTVEDFVPAILPQARSASDPCKPLADAIEALDKAFAGPALNPNSGTPAIPHDIGLDVTRAAYDSAKQQIDMLSSKVGACNEDDLKKKADNYKTIIEPQWDKAESLSHAFTFATTLEPLTNYSIFLLEQYQGVTTDACTSKDDAGKLKGVECEVVYEPRSTTISASGGFLISMLPAPTYARGSSPDGTTVLVVNDTGPVRTAFTALVNVKVRGPWVFSHICPSDDSAFGCAISVGPAFQLGSNNQSASRLGLIAGWSFQLWRYLYVTPAAHIGEYDNFPAGFTHAGQVIPPTFTGQLQPTKRTTVRFALGLTFKGWDLLHKNSTSQGTTKSGSGSTTK